MSKLLVEQGWWIVNTTSLSCTEEVHCTDDHGALQNRIVSIM